MNGLVYIAAMPHSGSTLLSLLLGRAPGLVALGEVNLQVERLCADPAKARSAECGCGRRVPDCPLWGPVLREFERSRPGGLASAYEVVSRCFRAAYPGGETPVDASKLKEPLLAWASLPGSEARVIHLARDFRSAIVSGIARRERVKGRTRPRWLLGFEVARRWLRENDKIERAIKKAGFPSLRLGYEELVLSPERAWPLLWEFLGQPPGPAPADIAGSANHIFVGNLMRFDEAKRQVGYDSRWFTRTEWIAPMLVFPRLWRANRRWVYSNGFFGRWEKYSTR